MPLFEVAHKRIFSFCTAYLNPISISLIPDDGGGLAVHVSFISLGASTILLSFQ